MTRSKGGDQLIASLETESLPSGAVLADKIVTLLRSLGTSDEQQAATRLLLSYCQGGYRHSVKFLRDLGAANYPLYDSPDFERLFTALEDDEAAKEEVVIRLKQ